ncbi:ATP-binding protein [Alkalibacillus aidingensis]|uniref:ATP-binding protein n=1 Tax=Alkalibacillus aidingensis TaxID=2747607 RepID=UPI0016605F24|nr:ATP-binding protein [Alkalibacillus aidingensis]
MKHVYKYQLSSPQEFNHIRKDIHEQLVRWFSGDQMLVDLAMFEAVTNSWRHGHLKDEQKVIDITVLFNNQSLIVRIKDEGHGFIVPNSLQPQNFFKKQPVELNFDSGRGIELIDSIMDEVIYSSTGNEVLMRKWYTVN